MWHDKPVFICNTTSPQQKPVSLPQTDGAPDRHPGTNDFATANTTNYAHTSPKYHQQHTNHAILRPRPPPPPPPPHHRPSHSSQNTVQALLPYCTTEPPLTMTQVIALSDVVGSLRELMQLALVAAAGDAEGMGILEGAVGRQGAMCIVEFFEDEWEVEG